jgi:1,4-alpha-glucan branching enzyme
MPAAKTKKQKVAFSYNAPEAKLVLLAGDFTAWEQSPLALKKGKDGVWKKSVSLAPGRYQYRFLVDGEWCDDPACSLRQANQFGSENCVCSVEAPPAAA